MARKKKEVNESEAALGYPVNVDVLVPRWLERLERLLSLPEGHPGVAEHVEGYRNRLESALGKRPGNLDEVRELINELRSK